MIKGMRHLFACLAFCLVAVAAHGDDAKSILDVTRIRGGICAVLGVGDGSLLANLADKHPYVVHGLDSDPSRVDAVRKALTVRALYGKASVELWNDTTLPYADNMVSLLIVLENKGIPDEELLRVLRPYGELFRRDGDGWKRSVKPFPESMDDWTHCRHGADGNPVSKDRIVDVPQRVQWLCGREAVTERVYSVFANGRMFVFEKGMVVARDAFNGTGLWEKPAKTELKEEQRKLGYENIGMIVAAGERVYFSSPDGVFSAHDAATGDVVQHYKDVGTPFLILHVNDASRELGTLVLADVDSIRVLDAKSGSTLWKENVSLPKHVVASTDAIYYVCGDFFKKERVSIVARELKSGNVVWEKSDFKEPLPWPERAVGCSLGYDRLAYRLKVPYRWEGGWRKYYEEFPNERAKERLTGGVIVLSAKNGEVLLETSAGGASARHGEWNDACWVNGALLKTGTAKNLGSAIYMYPISNLKSEPLVFDDNNVGDRGFGHCYPPTVTERFYINGQLNFVDLKSHSFLSNQITRGGCHMYRPGYLPANGLLYVTPKHCVCFPMLDGAAALAPPYSVEPVESHLLVKGPAFGAVTPSPDDPNDWPSYRHDEYRSAGTRVEVPSTLKVLWNSEVGGPDYTDPVAKEWLDHQYTPGRVTQPVVAGKYAYVAQPDTHRIQTFDVTSGKAAWSFTANGRIDTPPTIHAGWVLFGCRSGWMYALRASDGQMAWMLRLAPNDRRISVYGQVESPTPVAGSVIVINGMAYASAGLHPQADGGVRVFCIEPATGAISWQNKYVSLGYEERTYGEKNLADNEDAWRRTGLTEYEAFDLPVRDGDSVAVSRWQFDLKTGQPSLKKMSRYYFVKDTGVYMRRRSWCFAPRHEGLRTPLAAFLGTSVFCDTFSSPRLFRTDFNKDTKFNPEASPKSNYNPDKQMEEQGEAPSAASTLKQSAIWKIEGKDKKNNARAMLVAGSKLFVVNSAGLLEVFSTENGSKLGELKVGPVIWDGLAAAGGKLYVSLADGHLVCLGPP